MFPQSDHQLESVWAVIRRSKAHVAGGVVTGLGVGFGAKYVAAAFLVLWLLAGGQ